MKVRIEESWKHHLKEEFDKPYFYKLVQFVRNEYKSQAVYPRASLIFNAFECCSWDSLKVVIMGQDPYHGPNQANGLCFSVNKGIAIPPSLLNIFKEIKDDLSVPIPASGNLERWAKQGILLLNTTLTVRTRMPGSHQKRGWEEFTDAVIKVISEKKKEVVFLLWGAYAKKRGELVDRDRHHVLSASHPSPFSAHSGFFGCKHFSKTNHFLHSKGLATINW